LAISVLIPVKDYDFYPSDCCNFVKFDDTIAFDWLDSNLPPDANILIASTQMNVLPSGPTPGPVGTDAGIWIPALTGRTITYAQFETDFRLPDSLEKLCGQQVDYVYVGGTEQSFRVERLLLKEEWYQAVLSLEEVQLFRVIGC
jgi:hypothetical protein